MRAEKKKVSIGSLQPAPCPRAAEDNYNMNMNDWEGKLYEHQKEEKMA